MASSKFYQQKAINLMSLNITENGMYILIPSEKDDRKFYRVDLIEETMQVKKCSCCGFSYRSHCKHVTIINEAFAFYNSVAATPEPVEPKITEVEAGNWYVVNSNTQVWRNEEGQWMAVGPTANAVEIVEAHLAVAEAEQIVSLPARATRWDPDQCCKVFVDNNQPVDPIAQASKLKAQRERYEDEMLSAPLNRQGFSLLKVS